MSAASSRIYAIYVLSSLVNVAHLSPIWNYSESPDDVFWAFDCNFPEGDFANIKSMGEQCGLLCRTTSRCTHFTWTNYEAKSFLTQIMQQISIHFVCFFRRVELAGWKLVMFPEKKPFTHQDGTIILYVAISIKEHVSIS